MQRYRALGEVSRLEKEAKAFYDVISKATDAQKKAIFSYLTTKGAIVPNLPPALQRAAADVKRQINQIGDNMVARGCSRRRASTSTRTATCLACT